MGGCCGLVAAINGWAYRGCYARGCLVGSWRRRPPGLAPDGLSITHQPAGLTLFNHAEYLLFFESAGRDAAGGRHGEAH
jgi:hypothetical protein